MNDKAKEDRQKNDNNLEDILQSISDGVAYTSLTGEVIYVNKALLEMLDLKESELIGKNILTIANEILNFENLKAVIPLLTKLLLGKNIKTFEFSLKGKSFEIQTSISKKSKRLIGFVRDITSQKLIQTTLKARESNLHITLNSIGDGVISTDEKFIVQRINPIAEQLTGYKSKQAIGKPLSQIFKAENRANNQNILAEIKNVLESGKIISFTEDIVLSSSKNKKHYIAATAAPIINSSAKESGIVLVFRDISEKHTYEKALQSSYLDLQMSQRIAKTGSWRLSWPGLIINASLEALHIFGYSNNHKPSFKSVIQRINIEDIPRLKKALDNALCLKKPIDIELKLKSPENISQKYIHVNAEVQFDETGKAVSIVGAVQDISNRKKEENELKEAKRIAETSEEQIRALLELAPDGFLHGDKDGFILKVNSKIEDMTGFARNEIIGKHVTELFTKESQAKKPFDFEAVQRGEIIKNEREIILKNGGILPVEMLSRLMPDKTYQSFIRDITERIESEKALKESERSKSVLLSNLPGIAYRCHYDKKWTMEYISQGCYELTGYTSEELIDNKVTSFSELILPEFNDVLWEIWEEAVKTHSPAQAEYKIRTADNVEKWVWEQGVCIYDNQGNTLALEGLIIDITQRKKMEQALKESEEKYRLLFEKSPLGIIHFDSYGIITGCNQVLLNTLGTKADIIYGKNINILSEPQITNKANLTLNGMSEIFDGEFHSPFSHITIPLRVLFSPILSESKAIEGGIAIFENRSSQVMKETLEKQIAIAKETIKFKQNFLANMSHEIRTPLTGIIGMIDLLGSTKLDEHQSDYINTIKLSTANLREIINQILDYSKIEAGRLELKSLPFKSKSLLEDARNLFNALCKKDIRFETSISTNTPEYLIADKYRINQIVNNLISNAIKFTNKGFISLETSILKAFEKNKVLVKISVKDTGCGIEPELKSKLFQPFQQADTGDTRHIEGTGLGLSIAKELATMMGGQIGVESEYQKGSLFWFTFIATATDSDISTNIIKPVHKSHSDKNLRILLVEDKFVNQKVISLMLKSLGHEVTLATNGKIALELFVPDTFDLILMDIQMPVMDGITATKQLRRNYSNLPPIVGLSANAFEGDREKYLAQGMDEYLTKPVQKEDLDLLINSMFKIEA